MWAAIPAYFASFTAALLSGMPLEWVLLFAFSNPLGLAMYAMFYKVTQLRKDLRDLPSVVGFVLISLVASLAGSTGSFIWTHTNQVGVHDAYPIWQGWWLGEWLHVLVIVLPMLIVFGPRVRAWLAPMVEEQSPKTKNRRGLLAGRGGLKAEGC